MMIIAIPFHWNGKGEILDGLDFGGGDGGKKSKNK